MLLLPTQFCYLLRINIAFHYSILLSSMPLLQSLPLLIIIKLKHHNCSSGCPSLWLFSLFRKDVCKVQRSFVFYEPLTQTLLSSYVLLWFSLLLFLLWLYSFEWKPFLKYNFQDYGRMAYILFWFFFSYSLNHVLLTFFPSNQLLDQLTIHNCSPIDKISMICYRDHCGRLIIKILHLIFLVDNGKISTIILAYYLIFSTTHPSLVL